MIRQYAVNISGIGMDLLEPLRKLLSREKAERIDRFRFEPDKVRGTIAELLLRYLTVSLYGINNRDIVIERRPDGKPFFSGAAEAVFFNLSHASDWVVCGIGDAEVGIDVEHVKERNVSLAARVMSEGEYAEWMRLPEAVRHSEFYRFWTLKESYVKFLGTGLATAFSTITMRNAGRGFWRNAEDEGCILFSGMLSASDYIAVCTALRNKPELELTVHQVTPRMLLDFFKEDSI